jgi:hypothetical protein
MNRAEVKKFYKNRELAREKDAEDIRREQAVYDKLDYGVAVNRYARMDPSRLP